MTRLQSSPSHLRPQTLCMYVIDISSVLALATEGCPPFGSCVEAPITYKFKILVPGPPTHSRQPPGNVKDSRSVRSPVERQMVIERVAAGSVARDGMDPEVRGRIRELSTASNVLNIASAEKSSILLETSRVGLQQSALDRRKFSLRRERLQVERKLRAAKLATENLKRELQRVRQESATESQSTEEWLSGMRHLKDRQHSFQEAQNMTNDDLLRAGHRTDLNHHSIEELVAEKKALESRVRPILDTLTGYHNLPVDAERAEQLIIRKQEELENLRLQFDRKLSEAL